MTIQFAHNSPDASFPRESKKAQVWPFMYKVAVRKYAVWLAELQVHQRANFFKIVLILVRPKGNGQHRSVHIETDTEL